MSVLTPTEIAEDFINTMNPTYWNSVGERPKEFNILIKTYDTKDPEVQLDISFDYDTEDKEWCHYCELRDKESGELLKPLHGYGIRDVENLTNTIIDVLQSIKEE